MDNRRYHGRLISLDDDTDYALVHTKLVALVETARSVAARRVNALMSAVR